MTTSTQQGPEILNVRWLKSQPLVSFNDSKIDEENGIIRDVVMCQVGPAKGHGVNLEQEFVDALIEYDNQHFNNNGVKARFGHPAMSDTTMGTQMGVFKNFRVRGDQAIADLHLLDSAEKSPTKPGMKSWMLSMAKERPDFVMCSIVFKVGDYYQRKPDGSKYQIWYYKEIKDENDEVDYKWVRKNEEYGEVYVSLGEHHYTDLVEAGAATDSLFSQQFNQDKFAVQAVQFVQDHPALHNFLKENPDKLVEFASSVGVQLPKTSFKEKFAALKELFTGSETPETVDLSQYIALSEHEAKVNELNEKITALTTKVSEQEINLSEKDTKIEELNLQIEELEETPSEDPTELSEEPANDLDLPAYAMDENTRKAIELNKKRK